MNKIGNWIHTNMSLMHIWNFKIYTVLIVSLLYFFSGFGFPDLLSC